MKALNAVLIVTGAIAAFTIERPNLGIATPATFDLVMTNAYDAFGTKSDELTYDFGFCSIVRYGQNTILFDAGTDAEIFQRNLESLGVDPKAVDIAVASHGHHDHIGGFDYLLSVNPDVKIYLPKDFFSLGAPIGFPLDGREPAVSEQLPEEQRYYNGERDDGEIRSSGRFWKAHVEYVTETQEVLPGVTVIPTTSELMGTFIKYPPFDEQPRLVGMPELSVSFATEKGEVLITGCSHSSVETIVQEAQKALKRRIHLVGGGFHLIPYDRAYIEALARRMRDAYDVESVAPAHCTGHLAFAIFREVFGDNYRFFGLGATLEVR
jgi:7,8-dihydropterin-6-yl-methyl-4-(beta-D-ribofuranosyl)aminobenzene 5'-phosphate synthase